MLLVTRTHIITIGIILLLRGIMCNIGDYQQWNGDATGLSNSYWMYMASRYRRTIEKLND